MTERRLFRLVHDLARQNAHKAIDAAPDGYMVEVKEPTRSLDANAKLHACPRCTAHCSASGGATATWMR